MKGWIDLINFPKKELKERRALLLHSFFALLSRSFLSKTQSLLRCCFNNLYVLHYCVRVSSKRRRRQRDSFFCRREEGKAAANFLSRVIILPKI